MGRSPSRFLPLLAPSIVGALVEMRGAQSAAAHSIVADETKSVPVLDKGILAGDLFVDSHEDLLFSKQLEQMAELNSLPLYQLPNGYRCGQFAGEIAVPIGGLELPGQENGYHTRGAS